jgi:hypothetical protein
MKASFGLISTSVFIFLELREIEEKRERRLLIRLHIFYLILLINL